MAICFRSQRADRLTASFKWRAMFPSRMVVFVRMAASSSTCHKEREQEKRWRGQVSHQRRVQDLVRAYRLLRLQSGNQKAGKYTRIMRHGNLPSLQRTEIQSCFRLNLKQKSSKRVMNSFQHPALPGCRVTYLQLREVLEQGPTERPLRHLPGAGGTGDFSARIPCRLQRVSPCTLNQTSRPESRRFIRRRLCPSDHEEPESSACREAIMHGADLGCQDEHGLERQLPQERRSVREASRHIGENLQSQQGKPEGTLLRLKSQALEAASTIATTVLHWPWPFMSTKEPERLVCGPQGPPGPLFVSG